MINQIINPQEVAKIDWLAKISHCTAINLGEVKDFLYHKN